MSQLKSVWGNCDQSSHYLLPLLLGLSSRVNRYCWRMCYRKSYTKYYQKPKLGFFVIVVLIISVKITFANSIVNLANFSFFCPKSKKNEAFPLHISTDSQGTRHWSEAIALRLESNTALFFCDNYTKFTFRIIFAESI